VIFELNKDLDESQFLETLTKKNIYSIVMGNNKLKVVTHLEFTNAMHEKLLKAM
jgi:threonine aldolase